jgi:hypothetical protein
MTSNLISGFAALPYKTLTLEQCLIGVPTGTRLHRIIRLEHGWRLWLSTNDYIHGTYLECHNSGIVTRTTVREDEGDETIPIRPADNTIRYGWNK